MWLCPDEPRPGARSLDADQRLEPLPVETVVRSYLAGSGWKESGEPDPFAASKLPPGLKNATRLRAQLTLATRPRWARTASINWRMVRDRRGGTRRTQVRTSRSRLLPGGGPDLHVRSVIIADTRSSSGPDKDGTLTLMDEVLTPDSRVWPVEAAAEKGQPTKLDRQFVRGWKRADRQEALGKRACADAGRRCHRKNRSREITEMR